MEPQLTARLESILGFIESSVKATTGFVIEQAPDVVQQLLLWKFTLSVILCVLSVFLFCAGIGLVVMYPLNRRRTIEAASTAYKNGEAWTRYGGSGTVTSIQYDNILSTGGLFNLMLLTTGVLMTVFSIIIFDLRWVQIWIAPKVYLLEYTSSLLSK